MLPVADELGVTPYLKVPAANAAERQIARNEEGASLEEIYAEQVAGDGQEQSRGGSKSRREARRLPHRSVRLRAFVLDIRTRRSHPALTL